MASVRPFRAWLPPAAHAAAIASVPYDVVSTAEARVLARDRALSFLHVIRPEIDLPEGTDLYSDAVYEKARANLDRWLAEVPYTCPDEPGLFVYRLVRDGRSQTGVVGGCSVDEYDDGRIAIHERTRQAKEDDRTRHVVTMRCQAEPIFLAYRANPAIDALVAATVQESPLFDFTAPDGVRHTVWSVTDPAALAARFEEVPTLYVADGHHRTKSASRARATLREANALHTGDESYNAVMSVVFPDDQLEILPYNRVVTDLGGRTPAEVLAELQDLFPLEKGADPSPASPHSFALFADGAWHGFTIPPTGDGVIERLDVSLLQDRILAPIFGIEDPRRDPRIDFVGGIRGTDELERRATACGGVAFSLYATSMTELFAVADSGAIMPPKSTWFEPKLRSGLFVHRI